MSQAPIPTSEFTEDEIMALKLAGRVDASGQFVLPRQEAPAEVAAVKTDAITLDPSKIPAAPAGVAERIEAAKKVQSSFTGTLPTGAAVSADGGKAAEAVDAGALVANPDWAGKPAETPVDFADKERFLAHILGGVPFTKSYDIFGGLLTITFRTRTPAEETQIGRQVWLDVNHENSFANGDKNLSADERVIRYRQYQFVAALHSLGRKGDVVQPFQPFAATGNEAAGIMPIKAAHTKLREQIHSYPVYAALMNQHDEFEFLVAKLTRAADNPNFWKADAAT